MEFSVSGELAKQVQGAQAAHNKHDQERMSSGDITTDLRAVASLALSKGLSTNVDAELNGGRLVGWRLFSRSLLQRGAYHPGAGAQDEGEDIPGGYEYNGNGSMESVLEADPNGGLWVVSHRLYQHDPGRLDEPTRIPRRAIVDEYTGKLYDGRDTDWLIDIYNGAGGVYQTLANPDFVRGRLADFIVRRGLVAGETSSA